MFTHTRTHAHTRARTHNKESNKARLLRVQRLINLKMAKAYRTVSHEALCVVTGMIPIDIKIEEAARLYQITKGTANNNTLS